MSMIKTLQNTLSTKNITELVCLVERLNALKTTPEIANVRCAVKAELFARDSKKFLKWSSKNTGNTSPREFYL
jgi:hypothetical protein